MKTTKKTIIAVVVGILVLALSALCAFVLFNIVLPLLVLIVVSLLGQQPTTAPEVFPRADIIYLGKNGISFVNADGSGQDAFRFQVRSHSVLDEGREIPYLMGDYQTLVTIDAGYNSLMGLVYITHPGEAAVNCGWGGAIQFTSDQQHLLVATGQSVEKYRLTDCGTGSPPEKVWKDVSGIISPDEQYVVEIREGESGVNLNPQQLIFLRSLATGEERLIAEGDFPAWSRDGRWLAYTGTDGICVIENRPDAEPRQLVALERSSERVPIYDYDPIPPSVSWSPDGQWLVYTLEREDATSSETFESDYVIVKVNVETGKTIDVLAGGMYPYWIWPAEEP